MKHTIIKDYSGWLAESLVQALAEAAGPESGLEDLLKSQDLAALADRIAATDPAEVKSLPNYAVVTEWWRRGGPDLGLGQSLRRSISGAKREDRELSAKSQYYWLGGYAAAGRSPEGAAKKNFVKNVEEYATALKANAAQIAPALAARKVNPLPGWNNAAAAADLVLSFIKDVKAKSLNLKDSAVQLLVPSTASADGSLIFGGKSYTPTEFFAELAKSPEKFGTGEASGVNQRYRDLNKLKADIATLTAAMGDEQKLTTYYSSDNSLTVKTKSEIMQVLNDKVAAYVERSNKQATAQGKPAIDAVGAIKTAQDLYLVPRGTKLTLSRPPQPGAPVVTQVTGSYPENPNGDWNSAGAKRSTQFFGDDQIVIEPTILAEMTAAITGYVNQVKAANAKITGVRIWGMAGSSKVPSSYDPATKLPNPAAGYTSEKNVALCNDRLTSIKTALRTAFSQAGIADALIVEATDLDEALPNQGPDWTEADKAKYANRKTDAANAKEYEEKYGKFKFAFGRFEISYEASTTSTTPTLGTPVGTSNWDIVIGWSDEGYVIPPIKIPNLSVGSGGGTKSKGGGDSCPKW